MYDFVQTNKYIYYINYNVGIVHKLSVVFGNNRNHEVQCAIWDLGLN